MHYQSEGSVAMAKKPYRIRTSALAGPRALSDMLCTCITDSPRLPAKEVTITYKARLRKLFLLTAVCLTVLAGCKTTGSNRWPDHVQDHRHRPAPEERIKAMRTRLKNTVVPPVSFRDTDPREVIKELMSLTKINLVIDGGALRNPKWAAHRITVSVCEPMPLLDLLEIALSPIDFGYKVKPSHVWISHKSRLNDAKLKTREYHLHYGDSVRRPLKPTGHRFVCIRQILPSHPYEDH